MAKPDAVNSSNSRPSTQNGTEAAVLSVFEMTKGSVMLKAKRHGPPHLKRFVLTRDLSQIQWGAGRRMAERSVLIAQMTQLKKGQKSKVFQSCPVPQKESISFSVDYKLSRTTNTLGIVCMDKQQFEFWVKGLEALMNGFNDKNSVDSLHENDQTDCNMTQGSIESMMCSGGNRSDEDRCELYTWGDGTTGMLGHGDNAEENVPRVVEALQSKNISTVACGVNHIIAVTKADLLDTVHRLYNSHYKELWLKFSSIGPGELYTWGKQGPHLGYESEARKVMLPRLVEGLSEHRVTDVACGLSHTLVCTKNGRCFAFGDNQFGQLGVTGISQSYKPVNAVELESYRIIYVTCGSHHNAVISDAGLLWLWGANKFGQVGLDNASCSFSSRPFLLSSTTDLSNHTIIDVSCGTQHTVFLSKKGKLFGMGDNRENQLGINQRGKSEEPVLQVPFPTRIHFSKAAKPVRVSCGAFHSAALTDSGEVFTWGKGKCGRLGHGDNRDRYVKRSCLTFFFFFLFCYPQHHCQNCRGAFCASCTSKRTQVPALPGYPPASLRRVCDKCYSSILEQSSNLS
ncbi:PREDICTED: E3 ubiquitin-protein ligase HERC2-like [Acropora digitifera]|uniref:E3 ubiquitin-protein ligase HERC2-like n=1 Tax=Acropora digitifera TaxID=70779 RepID=UPI00077B11F4|nr:PREDICTED: E3 ubiquitin-protein ligase HERC2-like [Acropora digitifera]